MITYLAACLAQVDADTLARHGYQQLVALSAGSSHYQEMHIYNQINLLSLASKENSGLNKERCVFFNFRMALGGF